jgi:hypothetical protein
MKKFVDFMKKFFCILLAVVFSCESPEPQKQEPKPIGFNAPKTSKAFTNLAVLETIKSKVQASGKINSQNLETSEALEITFEGTDLVGIVLPIASDEDVQTNLITYLTADGKMTDAFFLNEIEQVDEYVYTSSYSTLDGDYLFSIRADNGYITFIGNGTNNSLGAKDGGNGGADAPVGDGNCFTEKFGECVKTVALQMTDGSILGSGAFLGCLVFGGGCAAAITVACTIMATGICNPGLVKTLNS